MWFVLAWGRSESRLCGISGHPCTPSLRGVSGHYSSKTGEPPYIQRRHFGAVIAPQYRVKSFHSDYRQQAEWTVVRGARPVHSACFFMAQAQRPGAISSPGSFVVRRFGAPLCSELWGVPGQSSTPKTAKRPTFNACHFRRGNCTLISRHFTVTNHKQAEWAHL